MDDRQREEARAFLKTLDEINGKLNQQIELLEKVKALRAGVNEEAADCTTANEVMNRNADTTGNGHPLGDNNNNFCTDLNKKVTYDKFKCSLSHCQASSGRKPL